MKTKSPHAEFYALLNQMGLKSADRRDFIHDYTQGAFDSLKELHFKAPNMYYQMLNAMRNSVKQHQSTADKWRKRVIASINGYYKQIGQQCNIGYIKATACRATGYDNFNKIPVGRLQNIYNMYLNKQEDFKRMSKNMRQELAETVFLN